MTKERINNTQLLADSGLRIVHIHPDNCVNGRGMTFAYRPGRGNSVVEVSTAIVNRGDTFSRKIGTKTAIEHFLAGKTVFMPLGHVKNPVLALQSMSEN